MEEPPLVVAGWESLQADGRTFGCNFVEEECRHVLVVWFGVWVRGGDGEDEIPVLIVEAVTCRHDRRQIDGYVKVECTLRWPDGVAFVKDELLLLQ